MNEHTTLEDLSAYTDDELSAPRRAQIEAHLAACVDCRTTVIELRWVVAFTRALPLAAMPDRAPIRVPRRATTMPARARWRTGWAAAGGIAAAFALGLAGLWAAGARAPAPVTAPAVETFVSDRAGASSAAPDGPAEAEAVTGPARDVADGDAVVAREPDSRAFGRAPTADSASAGYPKPLSTARQDDLDLYGGVPPPELGGDVVLPTVASMARARPTDALAIAAAPDPAAAAPAATTVVATYDAAEAAPEPAPTAAGGMTPNGRMTVLVLGAMLLLALSAALFVRAWSR